MRVLVYCHATECADNNGRGMCDCSQITLVRDKDNKFIIRCSDYYIREGDVVEKF